MNLELKSNTRKEVFTEIESYLAALDLKVLSSDFQRPWGGFFLLDESQVSEFATQFFPDVNISALRISGKLSPKILVVEPGKRLSWQYHHRRAEIWKVVYGAVDVVTSFTDEESDTIMLIQDQEIQLAQGQRHRIVGRDGWGVLAEIWQHTDVENPSDENDIVRVQDDFGR